MTLADRKTKILAPGGTTARYAASGHLIYSSKSTLYAVPFDLNKLKPRGDPVAILDDVAYHRANGLAQLISPRQGTEPSFTGRVGLLATTATPET
jgi:hypothetical protein